MSRRRGFEIGCGRLKKQSLDDVMPETKIGTVTVVITNWNGAGFIQRCLDAVFAQTQPPDEVVVVDNGSTDDSVALIRARYPSIHLIEQSTNEGFARGNNLGIQQARGDYILILNTDVFLDRDFLCRASQVMQQAPDIGSVAAKIYKADTDVIDYVGVYVQPWLKVVNGSNVANPEDVFAGSGAALFCRRVMLDDIAEEGMFFDESFFLCWEDMDLAWRAHLRKWRCVFAPDVIGHHLGSASQGGKVRTLSKPAFVQRHIWKNRYLIVTKNTSFLELLVLLPFLSLGELLHWLMILFRVPNRLPLFVVSHIDFLKLLPKVWRQRQVIQRRRRVGVWAILKFFRF